MRSSLVVAFGLSLLAPSVSADESTGKLRSVWPTMQLTLKTDGAAAATAGVDIQFGIPGHVSWEASIAPQVQIGTSSSGVAQVFGDTSHKQTGPTSWSAGGTLSLMSWDFRPVNPQAVSNADLREALARDAALRVCRAECDKATDRRECLDYFRNVSDDFFSATRTVDDDAYQKEGLCSKGNDVRVEVLGLGPFQDADQEAYRAALAVCAAEDCQKQDLRGSVYCARIEQKTLDRAKLCPDGLAMVSPKTTAGREFTSPYSRWIFSLAGTASGGAFSFYAGDAGGSLTKQSETKVGGAVAASVAFIDAPSRFTLEVPFYYSNLWSASTRPLHSCSDAGQLDGNVAQTCTDGIIGSPSLAHFLYASIQLGYLEVHPVVDEKVGVTGKSLWRFAAGPSFQYQTGAAGDIAILGLEAPFYLNFASAPAAYGSKNFQGIVRLTPLLGASHQSGNWASYVLMTLSLVADTTMFRRPLDWKQ